MPIRRENRARYPSNWKAVAKRIRDGRAGGRCECTGECGDEHEGGRCGVPAGSTIVRRRAPANTPSGYHSRKLTAAWRLHELGDELDPAWSKPTRQGLTVAHLDHTPENCDDGNLLAMCQRCHTKYDGHHHNVTSGNLGGRVVSTVSTSNDQIEVPGLDSESAAEFVEIDTLIPWDRNPRFNQHVVDDLAESIRTYGFGQPIVAWSPEQPTIIAGHTRRLAALQLGLDRVPVRFMPWLSEQRAHELALLDNKLGERAEWDLLQVLSLHEDGIDLQRVGFTDYEIREILGTSGDSSQLGKGITADEDARTERGPKGGKTGEANMARKVIVSVHFEIHNANDFERDLEQVLLPGETRSDALARVVRDAAAEA